MTPWERAVEAMASKAAELKRCECFPKIGTPHIHGGPSHPCLIHRVEADFHLLAAAPNLERHYREKLAEELLGKECVESVASRVDDLDHIRQPTHEGDRIIARELLRVAADHLTRKEVL